MVNLHKQREKTNSPKNWFIIYLISSTSGSTISSTSGSTISSATGITNTSDAPNWDDQEIIFSLTLLALIIVFFLLINTLYLRHIDAL